MGYTPKGRVYKLSFPEDDELHGLEIRTRAPDFGQLLAMGKLGDLSGTEVSIEQLEEVRPLFDQFTELITEWNLEIPAGNPLPTTTESFFRLEPGDVLRVMDSWMEAVAGVPAPLAQPSRDGDSSEVPPLTMEPLSESQAS